MKKSTNAIAHENLYSVTQKNLLLIYEKKKFYRVHYIHAMLHIETELLYLQ